MSSNDKENNPALEMINEVRKTIQNAEKLAVDNHHQRTSNPEALKQFFLNKLKLDSWKLFDEAIPFCIGAEPSEANAIFKQAFTEWHRLVRQQVEASISISLAPINPHDKKKEWRVKPETFLKWLIEKDLAPLTILKEIFEATDIKTKTTSPHLANSHGNSEVNAIKREQVLTAALAVLAHYPDECMRGGKISGARITALIEQKSQLWFGYEELPLSNRIMTNLINKALNTISD